MPYSGLDLFKDPSPRLPPDWPYEEAALSALLDWSSRVIIMDHAGKSHSVTLRFLGDEDLTGFVAFHQSVIQNLQDPQVLRADDPAFLHAHISKRGRTVGVFLQTGEMIGYGVVSFPKGDPDNLAPLGPLEPDQALHVAHFDGAAVDRRFRGNSIHKAINRMREQCALLSGYDHLMCTISPRNLPCLQNQMANGFMVVNIAQKYEKMDRLIALKSPLLRLGDFQSDRLELDLNDREALFEYLPQNWVATKMIDVQGVYKLVCSAL